MFIDQPIYIIGLIEGKIRLIDIYIIIISGISKFVYRFFCSDNTCTHTHFRSR